MKVIVLTQGKVTIVDDSDYGYLSLLTCRAVQGRRGKGTWYACARVDGKSVLMHRLILGQSSGGMEVDHIDGDGLNNQRSNLRFATKSQNMQNRKMQKNNTSGYRGVSFHKKGKKWVARIRVASRDIYLGLADTPEEAALLYDLAALEHFGEYAKINGQGS